ncbi:MAG TPA: hypothetical protein VJL58_01750 [Pyrinomonadaceae bacterium]|nr:hypothetical protein [Pyrinomonadaceae bacterium]
MKAESRRDKVGELIDRLGTALSNSDFRTAAGCFAFPSLIITEAGTTSLKTLEEAEQMFAKSGEWYHSRGLVSTKGELEKFEEISDTVASIDVRWPSFDDAGKEKQVESSHYIIQVDTEGNFKVCCALTRTK